jgi:hypothetical protein
MKVTITLVILVCITVTSVLASGPARSGRAGGDPHMTAEERAAVVKALLDSQEEYLNALQNLTDEQWTYHPSPFRWSVGQVAEHIVLAEMALFTLMERALASKPNPDWETKTQGKTQFLERVMPTRTGRAQAPWEIRPSGKLSKAEVISRYRQVRAKSLQFAQQTDLPLKEYTYDHPFPVFGTLNAYQWLIYIPYHNQRHDKQIAEVKASPGYPSGPKN